MPGVGRSPVRILALDLETSPNLAHVWGLWDQRVGLNQLLESTEIICFGARWIDQKKVTFKSVHHDGKQAMLEEAHRLLDEADCVLGWNSRGFDVKHLNREFLEAGMLPPSPHKDIDLMLAVKSRFRFPSNKLQYVSTRLGLAGKVQHSGHELWIKCMAGDDKAWAEMRRYQVQDVNLLLGIYERLRPWIPNHPHIGVHDGLESGCPACGSQNVQRRGTAKTGAGSYARFQCQACGKWARGKTRVGTSDLMPA